MYLLFCSTKQQCHMDGWGREMRESLCASCIYSESLISILLGLSILGFSCSLSFFLASSLLLLITRCKGGHGLHSRSPLSLLVQICNNKALEFNDKRNNFLTTNCTDCQILDGADYVHRFPPTIVFKGFFLQGEGLEFQLG